MRSLNPHIYRPFAISVAVGAAACGAALLLTSLIMYVLGLPAEAGGAFGLLSLGAGCLTAGYVLGRKKRRSGIKQGILCGAALFLLCFIGSFFFGGATFFGFLTRLFVCLAAGVVGGVAGVNGKIK